MPSFRPGFAAVAVVLGLLPACGAGPSRSEASAPPPAAPSSGSWGSVTPSDAEEPAESIPEVVARASLVPLVSAIRPGKPFLLALRFDVHPGYTLSWKYPGDIGKELQVRFKVPEGFELGAVRYPVPNKKTWSDDRVSFGYEKVAAVFVEVKPPRRLSTRDAYRFDVDAEWMACKRECIRESMNAFVELAVSWSGERAAEADELEPLLSSVPKPLSALDRAKTEWQKGKRDPALVITASDTRFLEFYPGSEDLHKKASVAIPKDGKSLRLVFAARPGDPPHTVSGVVLVERGGKPDYFELDVPFEK